MSGTQGVSGYRRLSEDEINLINECKALGNQIGEMVAKVQNIPGVDQRCAALARTELQTGMMWLVRSIAQPTGF